MSMEYLWTPWRMQYISGKPDEAGEKTPGDAPIEQPGKAEQQSTGCIFCDRARLPESYDRSNLIVLRAERNFVILNLYPYNSAHLMVVPYEHTASLDSLPADTLSEMMSLVQRMLKAIAAEYNPEGFNIGMNLGKPAGAGVADHLHMHVVPRWAGDTNFMPVVGGTKVMPELLERTLDRLQARLKNID
ncbi:MAG TPA: HIT domain-containing protein [Chloroflexia bacterium]|nr:HIT domain-containing protein [Chloroflexia bacterium]